MLLILNNLSGIFPAPAWLLIPLAVITALLCYVYRLRRVGKDLEKVDRINNVIWSNVREYLFLIDSNYKIVRTNFFEINQLSADQSKIRLCEEL